MSATPTPSTRTSCATPPSSVSTVSAYLRVRLCVPHSINTLSDDRIFSDTLMKKSSNLSVFQVVTVTRTPQILTVSAQFEEKFAR